MAKKGRMWHGDERRVLMNPNHRGDGLICAVRKHHAPHYVVTECYPRRAGEPARDKPYDVDLYAGTCSCAQPYPCTHAKAIRQADPQALKPAGSSARDEFRQPN